MAANDFYNENSNRAYPFLRGGVGVSAASGIGKLPDTSIVDAGFSMGLGAHYVDGTNKIWLAKIVRSSGVFYFHFSTDAPGAFDTDLVFQRTVGLTEFVTEYADNFDAEIAVESGASLSVYDVSDVACPDEPLWNGFLVTGDLTALGSILSGDGTLTATGVQGVTEPALTENLARTYVSSINVANQDRTRVTAAAGCPPIDWPYPIGNGVLFVAGRCLQNLVRFKAGYNSVVRQDTANNAIIFGASKGAGLGEPCGESPLFPGESPPAGSTLLSGGSKCNEVIRSINGVGGQFAAIVGKTGVIVTVDPDASKLIVNVNMNQLAICYSDVLRISETVP